MDYIVGVYNHSDSINDLIEWAAIATQIIAVGTETASESITLYATTGSGFTQSGSFLVALYTTSIPPTVLYKTGVSFTDGSATIDYDKLVDFDGNNPGDITSKGILTIDNFPDGDSLLITVYDYDEEIASLMDITAVQADLLTKTLATSLGTVTSSPVSLQRFSTTSSGIFNGTGVYLVLLVSLDGLTTYFMDQVVFEDGYAELDFETLELITDLPLTNEEYLQNLILNNEDFGISAVVAKTFNVSDTDDWNNAISAINSGNDNKNYVINVSNDISIPGINFVPSDLKVSIRGDKIISLSGNGYLLHINDKQDVILRDIKLKGHNENNEFLVYCYGNTNFIMRGNAAIYDNSGGGIGLGDANNTTRTFIMKDNASIYSNGVDGVYLGKHSTFIM